MEHYIENAFMNICVEHNDMNYNVEYEVSINDMGTYWSAITLITEYNSGEQIDEESPLYSEIEAYILDLTIEIIS